MMPVKVPPDLPELVRAAFAKARATGDLTYFPSQVAVLHVDSIPVSSVARLLGSAPLLPPIHISV